MNEEKRFLERMRGDTNRRARRVTLILALVVAIPSASRSGTWIVDDSIQHGGIARFFDYYVPDNPQTPSAPLLFVLHGSTQDKDAIMSGAFGEFAALAEQFGFLVVVPNGVDPNTGLSGTSGDFSWNDCRNDAGPVETFSDDVGFVSDLIDWMGTSQSIDDQRVYATGASNGGMMSYRLAFELSDRIAGVAAVIANLPANSECVSQPTFPLTVVMMSGTADLIRPYQGGVGSNPNHGSTLSAEGSRDFFASFLGTGTSPELFQFPDLDETDGGIVERQIYSGGVEGSRVVFHRVNGGGHLIPSIAAPVLPIVEVFFGKQNNDIEAAAEVWDNLSTVTLPEPGSPRDLGMVLLVAVGALSRRLGGRLASRSSDKRFR